MRNFWSGSILARPPSLLKRWWKRSYLPWIDSLFVIFILVRGKVLPALGQNLVDGHILVLLICRMVMDVDAQYVGNGVVDCLFHGGRDGISMADGQISIDANCQIDDHVRAKAMRLQFLQLMYTPQILEQFKDLFRQLPA